MRCAADGGLTLGIVVNDRKWLRFMPSERLYSLGFSRFCVLNSLKMRARCISIIRKQDFAALCQLHCVLSA